MAIDKIDKPQFMTDNQKLVALISAIAAAIAGIFTLILSYYSGPTPTPLPSPTPVPSVTASPSPVPSPSPSATASPTPIPTIPVGIRYKVKTVTTTKPSFQGAPIGQIGDVLVPDPAGEIVDALPPPRAFPFYAELQFDNIGKAYKIADLSENTKQRADIVKKFIKVSRDHGIEPIKQNIGLYPMDWDKYSTYGGSFRQLVIEGAIYPPCVLRAADTIPPPVEFLQKLEAAILSGELPKGSWGYAYDEPRDLAALITRLKLIRQHAPHLAIMVTTNPRAELAGLVDQLYPIFESGFPAGFFGFYGSCSSQGSCENGTVGIPTGSPMMTLDAPAIHAFAYPIVGYAMGAKAGLYYNMTEAVETALLPDGQYLHGGQGDGTLIYAGDNFTPWPSMRMLRIKQGLAYLEALRTTPDGGKAKLASLVQSWKVWEKDRAKY